MTNIAAIRQLFPQSARNAGGPVAMGPSTYRGACPYDAIFTYRKDQVPDWLKNSKVERAA